MKTGAGKTEETEQPLAFHIVDKRPFANVADLPLPAPGEEKPRYPTFVEELMSKLKATEDRFQEKKKQIDEEIARTKTRLENDYERKIEREKQKIVLPFLDVLDNLERAIRISAGEGEGGHLLEGVRMTANLFHAELKSLGVEAIAVLDQPFDPNLGQAVGTVQVAEEDKDGVVVDEVLRGYRMRNQLLRPAQVRVGQFQIGQPTVGTSQQ